VWLLQYAYSRSMNRRNYLQVRQSYNSPDVTRVDEADTLWSPARLHTGWMRPASDSTGTSPEPSDTRSSAMAWKPVVSGVIGREVTSLQIPGGSGFGTERVLLA
jgi:hypothetical protein